MIQVSFILIFVARGFAAEVHIIFTFYGLIFSASAKTTYSRTEAKFSWSFNVEDQICANKIINANLDKSYKKMPWFLHDVLFATHVACIYLSEPRVEWHGNLQRNVICHNVLFSLSLIIVAVNLKGYVYAEVF